MCQVHGNPSQKRIDKWPDGVLKVINTNRVKAGKKELSKSSPSVNVHGDSDQCAECDADETPKPAAEQNVEELQASREDIMRQLEEFMVSRE